MIDKKIDICIIFYVTMDLKLKKNYVLLVVCWF